MQKTKKKTKKAMSVVPKKTSATQQEAVQTEAQELKPTTPVKSAQKREEKSILKPFFFFAVFVALVGGAMLYPYFEAPKPFEMPQTQEPPLALLPTEKTTEEEPLITDESINEPQIVAVDMEIACVAKDKLILSQKQTIDELNEKIHRLELDALNMKEKMNASVKATPLSVRLMEELYAGKPFATTLNALLMNDRHNPFGLMVQEKLGPFANSGIPTPEDLEKMFLNQMKMAENTFYITRGETSWNTELWNYFKSLVHIYPEKMQLAETDGVDLLFLARNQVLDNDFSGALLTIEKMPLSVQQMLNGFVQNATRYIEAQHIIDAYLQN